ncbi:copper-translocating P-type ATPase [Pullulanibacillus camelliae]|uniref:Cd(2+)-exporting ATPase n=1 Tax=Pullulanibacillus camelliae TaxID=1707096 RepID=A0A8J3E238_9BACL|nr:heavy metal translocating P-type ATPase [Pullulanibacillus camelliae]GGE55880.1 copper-translocating P-type ATPase [Pullulanibacillus camelliae]
MADACCGSEAAEKASCCNDRSRLIESSGSKDCCRSKGTAKAEMCCNDPGTMATKDASSCFDQTRAENGPTQSRLVTEAGERLTYHIYGMDCPSCAMSIEKGLSQLENIEAVKVNYNTAKLQLVSKDRLSFERVEHVIQKLGYRIEPLKQHTNVRTYDIEGMDCGSCATSIEKHLQTLPSVRSVSVNFSTGKMKIDHESHVEEVISEVAKLGYKASLLSKMSPRKDETLAKNSAATKMLISTGILIILGLVSAYISLPKPLANLLYAATIIMVGYKPFKSAYFAIKSRSIDMNVLMSAAALGAVIIGQWLEGATVVWLFALGTALQNRSIAHTRNSIRNLMTVAPAEAWIKAGSQMIKKPVEEVSIGDILIVKPGEKIPLDGVIVQGESSVNQAPITGESIPVDKGIHDHVFAGTVNESGALDIQVTKLVEDTTLARIIHLVEEAQEQKAPTQAFVDRFARVYTPVVFIIALCVMVLPPLFIGNWGNWFYKGLELLVIACPCALVISTPVAIVSALGNAAKNGVLIKGGTFLEKAGAINAIAFDKTGTLTAGEPKVSEVKLAEASEIELLSIALTLETRSTHPIAKAIVDFVKDKGIAPQSGTLFKTIVGKGVQATINGQVYYAGNRRLFEDLDIPVNDRYAEAQGLKQKGRTVVFIGTGHKLMGIIAVADTIRPTTIKTLSQLRQVGVGQLAMLTGDNEETAQFIAQEAQISRYFAELLPEDKVKAIKQLQHEGYNVAMVGDGINDAPALATADLGIAMGGAGTDTAMETADSVLMADNLEKLPHMIQLSRKALSIIKQNIWFSLIIKAIALMLIFPGWLTLWLAVLSDTGAAIIVILNAMRLLK